MLDFPVVPEIKITTKLKDVFEEGKQENKILEQWFTMNLGMTWEESVETAGLLGGYDPTTGKPCSEGFVVRNKAGFETNNGDLPVENNEFDNLFKLVRASHVKTDVHWTKTWKPAKLINYEKHKWFAYKFLEKA